MSLTNRNTVISDGIIDPIPYAFQNLTIERMWSGITAGTMLINGHVNATLLDNFNTGLTACGIHNICSQV